MRKVVLVVLVLLVVAGGWLLWGGGAPPGVEGRGASGAAVAAVQARASAQDGEAGPAGRRVSKDRSERDALRRRIVEALERREGDAGAERRVGEDGEGADAAAARKRKAAGVEEEAATAGGLVDRSGNRGYLMKVMNEELMPLVDECYALARQARPALAGELRLDVTLLGDAELGGVVDGVEPGRDNGLADPGLVECVQQSILALTLPPPPQGGRDDFSLSLKLTPEDGGATAG